MKYCVMYSHKRLVAVVEVHVVPDRQESELCRWSVGELHAVQLIQWN